LNDVAATCLYPSVSEPDDEDQALQGVRKWARDVQQHIEVEQGFNPSAALQTAIFPVARMFQCGPLGGLLSRLSKSWGHQ